MHPCFHVSPVYQISNQVHFDVCFLVFFSSHALVLVDAVSRFTFLGLLLLSYSRLPRCIQLSSIYFRPNSHVFFIVTLPFQCLNNIVCGLLSAAWHFFSHSRPCLVGFSLRIMCRLDSRVGIAICKRC